MADRRIVSGGNDSVVIENLTVPIQFIEITTCPACPCLIVSAIRCACVSPSDESADSHLRAADGCPAFFREITATSLPLVSTEVESECHVAEMCSFWSKVSRQIGAALRAHVQLLPASAGSTPASLCVQTSCATRPCRVRLDRPTQHANRFQRLFGKRGGMKCHLSGTVSVATRPLDLQTWRSL